MRARQIFATTIPTLEQLLKFTTAFVSPGHTEYVVTPEPISLCPNSFANRHIASCELLYGSDAAGMTFVFVGCEISWRNRSWTSSSENIMHVEETIMILQKD